MLLVHHAHDEQHRILAPHGFAELPFRADLDARVRIYHAERAVGRRYSCDRVAQKIQKSRRVDQIDFRVHPLGECAAKVDGESALRFFGGIISERCAVLDGPVTLAGPRHEGERIDQ